MRFFLIFSLLCWTTWVSGQTPASLTLPAGTSMLLTGGGPGQDAAPAGSLPVAATLCNSAGSPVDVRVMKDGERDREQELEQELRLKLGLATGQAWGR